MHLSLSAGRRRFISRAAVATVVTATALGFIATPSAAMRHLRLVKSSPMADSTVVGSPDAIRLWLSEPVELRTTKIQLTIDASAPVVLAAVTRDTAKGAPVVAMIPKPLASGGYKVTWKTMSKDGHVVNGTFGFRVGASK